MAGVPSCKAAPRNWTRKVVLEEIRRRASQGLSLGASDVHDQAAPLWRAYRRLFREPWILLLRRNGIDAPGRRSWNREAVLAGTRSLASAGVREARRRNAALVSAAVRRFGSWSAAVSAARGTKNS
jgi:hypothetical protein